MILCVEIFRPPASNEIILIHRVICADTVSIPPKKVERPTVHPGPAGAADLAYPKNTICPSDTLRRLTNDLCTIAGGPQAFPIVNGVSGDTLAHRVLPDCKLISLLPMQPSVKLYRVTSTATIVISAVRCHLSNDNMHSVLTTVNPAS